MLVFTFDSQAGDSRNRISNLNAHGGIFIANSESIFASARIWETAQCDLLVRGSASLK
jgi:hypothetical protein